MTHRIIFFFLIFIHSTVLVYGQSKDGQKVFTTDIDHFWMAYDSVQTTTDSLKQLLYLQNLYIDPGTEGLHAFMKARNYSAPLWVKLIRRYPKYWSSIRPNTLTAKLKEQEIEKNIRHFKVLYPELKEAKMYFTVGGLRSGGTTKGNMVLIGTEIATGNAETDVSEFSDRWLSDVFRGQAANQLVPINVHEYVHTQQQGESYDVLSQCIREGSCDFIAELVIRKPMQTNYIDYGKTNETKLKERFKAEMFSTAYGNWLYNGGDASQTADLGYFMGYMICKSYYDHAVDKKKAIKEIIELNYSDSVAVEAFLVRSEYFGQPIHKEEIVKAYENNRPTVLRLEPFANGDTTVSADIKQMKVVFSELMSTKRYSIDLGKGGDAYDPISKMGSFSEDKRSITINLDMQSNHEYEFVITGRGFKSASGYPLKPCRVKFKTK